MLTSAVSNNKNSDRQEFYELFQEKSVDRKVSEKWINTLFLAPKERPLCREDRISRVPPLPAREGGDIRARVRLLHSGRSYGTLKEILDLLKMIL